MKLLQGKDVVQYAADNVDMGQMLKALARTALEQSNGNGHIGEGAAAASTGSATRPLRAVAKPGLVVAGGAAAITAASAAISAARRKQGA